MKKTILAVFGMILASLTCIGCVYLWTHQNVSPTTSVKETEEVSQAQETPTHSYDPITIQTEETQSIEESEAGVVSLKELRTIGSNSFRDMFHWEKNVTDYYGNVYDGAYLMEGDGALDTYRNAVTFLNTGDFTTVEGNIVLSATEKTLSAINGDGFMRIVLLDRNEKVIDWSNTLSKESGMYKDSFAFDISGMEEFTLAIDASNGWGSAYDMYVVGSDFVVTK